MTESYESISCWGMFPTQNESATYHPKCEAERLNQNNFKYLSTQFHQGWEAALGLHLLEERN